MIKKQSGKENIMFCGKCGAENLNGAAFCKQCGAQISEQKVFGSHGPISAKRKRNLIIGIVIAISVVITVIVISVLVRGGSYRTVVNKFVEASFEADGRAVLSLLPNEVVQSLCEKENMTRKEVIGKMNDEFEKMLSYINRYLDNWDYSYQITKVEDYSSRELKSTREDYEYDYNIVVKAAKMVAVEISISMDSDTKAVTMEIPLIKIKRSWYLDYFKMEELL